MSRSVVYFREIKKFPFPAEITTAYPFLVGNGWVCVWEVEWDGDIVCFGGRERQGFKCN